MDNWTIVAVILMIVLFLALPVLLAVLEYRVTQTSKKRGIYLLAGILVLGAFMPAYAIYLGTILLITYKISLRRAKNEETQHKHM